MMRRFSLAACGLALLCGWPLASAQVAKDPAKSAPPKAPAVKAPPAKAAPKSAKVRSRKPANR